MRPQVSRSWTSMRLARSGLAPLPKPLVPALGRASRPVLAVADGKNDDPSKCPFMTGSDGVRRIPIGDGSAMSVAAFVLAVIVMRVLLKRVLAVLPVALGVAGRLLRQWQFALASAAVCSSAVAGMCYARARHTRPQLTGPDHGAPKAAVSERGPATSSVDAVTPPTTTMPPTGELTLPMSEHKDRPTPPALPAPVQSAEPPTAPAVLVPAQSTDPLTPPRDAAPATLGAGSSPVPVLTTPALPQPTIAAEPTTVAANMRWRTEDTERHSAEQLRRVRACTDDPANPALALRASGRLLDQMELACCWLHYEASAANLPLPRFRVTARPSQILEPELRQMALVLRAALDRGEQFTILWDLRRLRPPSLAALNYGLEWQSDNAADIEQLGTSIVVLVSSPITRACANLCVRVCSPPQPVLICRDEAEATAFADEQHKRKAASGVSPSGQQS
uniref:Uncharacterized protein n=1 Tax=Coccolithus braarudii TaxID=221442 RepID=A0A7S0Q1F8_9EUKA|mmetsp:Transcript_2392/g.4974  ORF Transcript_2392/g.4974 Transcript_2392/m.4974 type:complete len:449 (+) Transcript_2392:166-1512(+)